MGVIEGSCIVQSIAAFDLSSITLFGAFSTLGISMPSIGWVASVWTICIDRLSLDDMRIGTLDLKIYFDMLLSLTVLSVVVWIRKR